MAKSELEKQLERQRKETKKLAEDEARRSRASSVVNGQEIKKGLRLMDKTSEEVLGVLLKLHEEELSFTVHFVLANFSEYVQESLAFQFEKLSQYGMIINPHIWISGSGEVTLLPDAFEYFVKKENVTTQGKHGTNYNNNKVFIVHGHDNESKQTVARFLEKLGFQAIILHEQPDGGKTIIEKIEQYSDVAFAVVLYTECDLGRRKDELVDKERFRARQNVVFEHGYLIGKLGRQNVCAIVKGHVETPGDISGVVYTPMNDNDSWKIQLAQNMDAVGMNVDMNKIFK